MDMDMASSDIHRIIPDNVEDVIMNVGPDMSQGLIASTSNSESTSSDYSCSEPSVTRQILSSLQKDYKERSIHDLAVVVTKCKKHYNAYAKTPDVIR